MIRPVNEMCCPVCRALYVGADVLCARCRAQRARWHQAEAEIRRLEDERGPKPRALRIIDLRRSRERAS